MSKTFQDLMDDLRNSSSVLTPVISLSKEEMVLCCLHSETEISEHSRILSCCKCGCVLNTTDYLITVAKKETAFLYQQKKLKDQQYQLMKSVENLQRQEKNIKSRIKRAKNVVTQAPKVSSIPVANNKSELEKMRKLLGGESE